MTTYRCEICNIFEYDSTKGYSPTGIKHGTKPEDFPDSWRCPICNSDKTHLKPIKEKTNRVQEQQASKDYLKKWKRNTDEQEPYMTDIHAISESGKSITEPMRTKKQVIGWDSILIKGAQLFKIPLNKEEPVSTKTIIGPKAKHPLVIETPIYITHMSFGALSKEIKIALAIGSAKAKTAMCSGEGGILEESYQNAYRYIFEYVPNRYSVTDKNLKKVDAIEIKFGQSTKPGMGGHLPKEKVTKEISEIRGFPVGQDIISPAHFNDILTKDDLKNKVDWLRTKSGGKPIGLKLAAGHIESDLNIATYAKPDFITIDGRPGATASSPKFIKESTSIPTLFALHRARKHLDKNNIKDTTLIITGGLRISSDFAKAIALGADAIAIGTSALMAAACQQYRICHTGKCPVGVTTQNPNLRKRLDIDISAKKLENFLKISTEELKDIARLTGNNNIHNLKITDLCTTDTEISDHTDIEHV